MDEEQKNDIQEDISESEETVLDISEDDVQAEEVGEVEGTSELYYLQEINSTLEHIDNTLEYGVCLVIIIILVVIMNYIYKFFNLFF